MMQSNGWTGATPQVLPPGKIAVEQQGITPPTEIFLAGSLGMIRGLGDPSSVNYGSVLVPLPATSNTTPFQTLSNQFSGFINCALDGGTTPQGNLCQSALQLNTTDLRLRSTSLYNGGTYTLDATSAALRFVMSGGTDWQILPATGGGTGIIALNANGCTDWRVMGGNIANGTKQFIGCGGLIFSSCHLTGATTGQPNVIDGGGLLMSNCYIDSCPPGSPCLLQYSGGGGSLWSGTRFFQNTAAVTGIPVVNITSHTGQSGLTFQGGIGNVNGAGSSFSAFMAGANQNDICVNVHFNAGFTGGGDFGGFFDTNLPGYFSGLVVAGNTLPNVAPILNNTTTAGGQ